MTVGPRASERILANIRKKLGLAHGAQERKELNRNLRDVKIKLAAKRRAERKKALIKARRAEPPKKKAA